MRYYVRKEDTTRLVLALGATLQVDEAPRQWQGPEMEKWYTPAYQEYATPLGRIVLSRYDVATPKPIAPGGVPAGANVVIGCSANVEAMLASIPYLWTDTTPPKPTPKPVVATVVQASLFDT